MQAECVYYVSDLCTGIAALLSAWFIKHAFEITPTLNGWLVLYGILEIAWSCCGLFASWLTCSCHLQRDRQRKSRDVEDAIDNCCYSFPHMCVIGAGWLLHISLILVFFIFLIVECAQSLIDTYSWSAAWVIFIIRWVLFALWFWNDVKK